MPPRCRSRPGEGACSGRPRSCCPSSSSCSSRAACARAATAATTRSSSRSTATRGILYPNHDVATRYFSGAFVPNPNSDFFAAEKPENGFRVIVQGGSSAAGYPYYRGASFPQVLQRLLKTAYPERTVEVVNTAMAAVNSYTLLDFADEIVAQKPDAVLIYAGHNEYYGALGAASSESFGKSPGLVRAYLRLRRFRTVQLVRAALARVQRAAAPEAPKAGDGQPSSTLMAAMVGEQSVSPRLGDVSSVACGSSRRTSTGSSRATRPPASRSTSGRSPRTRPTSARSSSPTPPPTPTRPTRARRKSRLRPGRSAPDRARRASPRSARSRRPTRSLRTHRGRSAGRFSPRATPSPHAPRCAARATSTRSDSAPRPPSTTSSGASLPVMEPPSSRPRRPSPRRRRAASSGGG